MRTKGKLLITLVVAFVMSLSVAVFGLTAFAAPVQEAAVHKDFVPQWGTWVQYRNADNGDGDQQLTALALKELLSASGSSVDQKAFIASDKLNAAESFSISFETAVPFAESNTVGSVGFYARAAVDGNTGFVGDNMSGFLVELFKDNMRIVVRNKENALSVVPGSEFSQSVAEGEFVKIDISVSGDTVTAKVLKADTDGAYTEISSAKAESGIQYSAELRSGFSAEKTEAIAGGKFAGTYAVFRNIVYTANDTEYRAYPFATPGTAPDPEPGTDPDPTPGTEDEYTPVNALNPNFAVTAGGFMGGADDKYVVTSSLHPQMNSAVMISDFGGVYGENFDLTFKVKTPSQTEIEDADAQDRDPNAGFFFRQRVSHDLYSGIYIRIEKDKVMIVNDMNNADADAQIPSTVTGTFKSGVRPSAFFTMHINVQDDMITVDLKDEEGNPVTLVYDGKDVTSLSVKARAAFDPVNVAGFAGEHMTAVISDIVMTSGDKEFMAYPFDPDKTMDLSDIEITGDGMTLEPLTEENADNLLPDDVGLIGQEFEFILYVTYDGKPHDVHATLAGGAPLPDGFTASFEYRVAPNWEFVPWVAQTTANRHGMAVSIADADGYVYARVNFAFKIIAKELTISGVTATDKQYDGSAEVALSGGTLNGVVTGDDVGFDLGIGIANQSSVGQNIPVTVNTVTLTGEDAANYTLVQPEGLTVNITKGKAEKPESIFIEGKTDTTITVEETYGAEYSIDGTTWQDSNEFTGLNPGTEYTVYMRMKASDNAEASDAVSTTVTTNGAAETSGGCGSQVSFAAAFLAVAVLGAAVIVIARKAKN